MTNNPTDNKAPNGGFIDTIQSLIVAFVLAMTFRGFVVEGFVIPTGSMAPTLLGDHWLVRSSQTGTEVPVGLDDAKSGRRPDPGRLEDHNLGRGQPLDASGLLKRRLGDRILVCKYLWPFFQPERFDVAVFKNPTLPDGPSGNYIKRVVGLPDETVWLVDGDVFVRPDGATEFTIQRKPEHVQRAVWQSVWSSNAAPVAPEQRSRRWAGPPWLPKVTANWQSDAGSTWTTMGGQPSTLTWDMERYPLDDWANYNMLSPVGQRNLLDARDLRFAVSITPKGTDVKTHLDIVADSHVFRFSIESTNGDAVATVSMWPEDDSSNVQSTSADIGPLRADHATGIIFERVDQSMAIRINGRRVVDVQWDWKPIDRLENVTGRRGESVSAATLLGPTSRALPVAVTWTFEGSPVSLANMSVDRDLYYRSGLLHARSMKNPPTEGYEALVQPGTPGYGTHPDKLAVLGPGEYFMLGDNSARSLDSRLWGAPSPKVAAQLNPRPFVVDRRLLIGKAWVVYYPAPHSLTPTGMGLIPDVGRIRFIR
jgi:signal peptidase I